ncbi:MAG: hypothetical protein R3253_17640, partial [Longimicrobiales bacterium]|nr:hypothetical protein [Longimicrobiales bacterium]
SLEGARRIEEVLSEVLPEGDDESDGQDHEAGTGEAADQDGEGTAGDAEDRDRDPHRGTD